MHLMPLSLLKDNKCKKKHKIAETYQCAQLLECYWCLHGDTTNAEPDTGDRKTPL